MPAFDARSFLAGVIEGFYGPPWSTGERRELFEWMTAAGLNTYFYCPKDDWKQRAIWREPYSDEEASGLANLIRDCEGRGLRFIYAVSPGLDIRYSRAEDLDLLRRRFGQMLELGAGHFALLFDDIPDRLDPSDLARWGSLAAAQAHVANTLQAWVHERRPDGRFLFCPTPYCSRMVAAGLGGQGYLAQLGRALAPEIDVLWTGPEIISREITVPHVTELAAMLDRRPVIWDNLHANDYDGHRFYCGPYAGRPRELRSAVAGLLLNPNCEFPLNFVPIRTLGAFVSGDGPWDPRAAYLDAMRDWLPRFATCGTPLSFDDLVLLGDCYYLPHELGPTAEALDAETRDLLGRPPETWGDAAARLRVQVSRLRDIAARMAELRDRPLFHALGRRAWELREEMDLLEKYLAFRSAQPDPTVRFGSDFHLPGTYRGGLVARLQRLLVQRSDGAIVPAHPTPDL